MTKTISTPTIIKGSICLLYAWFCYLMLQITLQYIPFDTDVAFLRIKQDYVQYAFYQWAFFIHAYTAILALPAGFTQFSSFIRIKMPRLHRWSGWMYALIILIFAAPSGLVIAYFANGGWTSQLAFCLLAILWFYFTLKAIQTAKKKDFIAHRNWMYRSFALTLSAITLRIWKYVIVWAFSPRPMDTYRIVAWLGWLLNLVIIEIIIIQKSKK